MKAEFSLTKREKEILSHLMDGNTSKQIGSLLRISNRTVEVHRRNIMMKARVKNTAGLAKYVVVNGYI